MNPIIVGGAVAFAIIAIVAIVWAKKYVALPQWLQTLLAGVVVGGMFALVWYTQKESRKQEAVFMGICWDAAEQAHYPVDGIHDANCANPQPLNWTKSPKLVYWGLSEDYEVYRRESYKLALDFWNKAVGKHVVEATDNEAEADIEILDGAHDGHGAMATSHCRQGGQTHATILVKAPGNIRLFMLQLEHELGHAMFGLSHDRGRSIMHPRAGEGEEESLRVWFVTEKDKKAIRAYLPD